MTRISDDELRARVLLDRIARTLRRVLFVAALTGVVGPVTWRAFERMGELGAAAVLALLLWIAVGILPQGPSLARKLGEIDGQRY